MKKKILLALTAIMALSIGVAAFAYTNASNTKIAAASCCPKGDSDSCPMKMNSDTKTAMNHDSCPMKMKDSSGTATASCCDNCDSCKGDSCPMKKKNASATNIHGTLTPASTKADGKSCDCSCCNHDKKTTDAPAA